MKEKHLQHYAFLLFLWISFSSVPSSTNAKILDTLLLKLVEYRDLKFYVGNVHYDFVSVAEEHVLNFMYDSISKITGRSPPAGTVTSTPSFFSFFKQPSHPSPSPVHLSPHHPSPPCLVVDVGMNDGYYTQMAASLGCRVVSFELQENCIQIATAAARVNGFNTHQISMHNHPVSDTNNTELSMHISDDYPCSGTFGFTRVECTQGCEYKRIATTKTFTTMTLSSIFPPSQSRMIDFLKVDVEGHDPFVVRGAMSLFKAKHIRHASIEIIHKYWIPGRVEEFVAIYTEILSYGYEIRQDMKFSNTIYRKSNKEEFAKLLRNTETYGDFFFSIIA